MKSLFVVLFVILFSFVMNAQIQVGLSLVGNSSVDNLEEFDSYGVGFMAEVMAKATSNHEFGIASGVIQGDNSSSIPVLAQYRFLYGNLTLGLFTGIYVENYPQLENDLVLFAIAPNLGLKFDLSTDLAGFITVNYVLLQEYEHPLLQINLGLSKL